MKHIIVFMLCGALLCVTASCSTGSSSAEPTIQENISSSETESDVDSESDVNSESDGDFDFDIDSVEYTAEAAFTFLEETAGLKGEDVSPEWAHQINEDKEITYGQSSPQLNLGRSGLLFEKLSGKVEQSEYEAWVKKVFAATASVADDGQNVLGYAFAKSGQDALGSADVEEILARTEFAGWSYRKNGQLMDVYVSRHLDLELHEKHLQETSQPQDSDDYYYSGLELYVHIGLQAPPKDEGIDLLDLV